jgi:DNA-binding response OmpR family regulator
VAKKILVVEDDPVIGRVLRDFLDVHGYETLVARTGIEGVVAFETGEPDMMLIDVMLPRKSGFEVCFDVKRTERGRRTPVLLMSAVYTDADHATRYARDDLKAQGYLIKPFDLDVLLERVRFFIGEA